MHSTTSSASYTDLFRYARKGENIDHDLIVQADRLINRLSYFEATCREPGFQISSDGLGSALRSYGTRALPIDANVRTIGEAFQRADNSPMQIGWHHKTSVVVDWKSLLPFTIFPQLVVAPLLSHAVQWVTENPTNAWTTFEIGGEPVISLLALKTIRETVSVLPGRVGVSAPKLSRWYLDLSARHPYKTTLIKNLTEPLGKSMLFGAMIQSAGQYYYDFHEFRDDKLEMASAFVLDGSLILVKSAGTAVAASAIVIGTLGLLGISVVSIPALALGAAIVGVSVALGLAVDHFILDPYLKGDMHTKHIEILADNFREFKNHPGAFTKVLGSEFVKRLSDNGEEFRKDRSGYMKVFGNEVVRMVDEGLGPRVRVASDIEQLKNHADQLVNFIMGDPEQPPACIEF